MRRLSIPLVVASLSLAACIGNIGGGPEDAPVTTSPSGFECDPDSAVLTASPIKRLAKHYFKNAVTDFLSPLDEATRVQLMDAIRTRLELVPIDTSDHYEKNDGTVTQDHVDAVFGVAIGLAVEIDESAAGQMLAMCGAGSDKSALQDDACLTSFLRYYGRKTFRRPMSAEELDDFKAYYQDASAAGVDAFAALVARLIAHPSFYYHFDAEGETADGEGAVLRLTKWELLSKITFLFWAGPPSDALYDRVETTDITEDAALDALVDEVLADPKSDGGVLAFYREWLELDDTKNPATEGNLAAAQTLLAGAGLDALPSSHREDMIQEVLALTRHYTLGVSGTLDDILTSPYSFAKTPALATIYGVEPWDGSVDNLVAFPEGQRSGLLSRAALVANNAEFTNPILKGKRIRTRVLCDSIPPPPPNVNIVPLAHPVDKTTRQAVDEATADSKCQTCHQLMNPLGFLSENYDPLGRFRDKELRFDETGAVISELELDTRAVATLAPDDDREFADAIELGAGIAESAKADACLVRNYFEFVHGRKEDEKLDGCVLASLDEGAGNSLKTMLKNSVMHVSFRQRKVK